MPLKLEYICTEAETREAQSLHLRRAVGGGSRWRTLLVLFGILAGLLTLLYFRIRTEVAPKYQPWFLAGAAALFFLFVLGQKFARKKSEQGTKLEVSERELVIVNGPTRVALLWSAFSQCLESAQLFVLLDRPQGFLLVVPKRVFPDEAAQNSFRAWVNQPASLAPSAANEFFAPAPTRAADGIVLKDSKLGYRDYLGLIISSWKTKGIILLVFGFITVTCIQMSTKPNPQAVHSMATVYFCFALPFFSLAMVGVILLVAFVTWRGHAGYLVARQTVISSAGIETSSRDGTALLAWSDFKYYAENRWGFIVWNPASKVWDLLPKRAFASARELEQCRELVQTNLRRSRWFSL